MLFANKIRTLREEKQLNQVADSAKEVATEALRIVKQQIAE